MRLAGYED